LLVTAFPPEYCPDLLRSRNPDLAGFDDDALRSHYLSHGLREGRLASEAAVRENLVALVDPDAEVLELGPGWSPVFRGPKVRYLDVLTTEGLKARAVEHGAEESLCPEIHYVNGLNAIDRQFDVLFSSHNIEHQPDLVRHLSEAARVLRPGGVYMMLIPDKRYCFDHFLPETTIAEVLEAFMERRTRHAARHVIEHIALTAHNHPSEHWAGVHGQSPFEGAAPRLKAALDKLQNAGDSYIDVHAWKFTPSSFRRIFADLGALGLAPFEVVRVYETPAGRNEFGVVLRKA
jgi:SAM-dependent methyltransferase